MKWGFLSRLHTELCLLKVKSMSSLLRELCQYRAHTVSYQQLKQAAVTSIELTLDRKHRLLNRKKDKPIQSLRLRLRKNLSVEIHSVNILTAVLWGWQRGFQSHVMLIFLLNYVSRIAFCWTNKDDLLVETWRSESVYLGFSRSINCTLQVWNTVTTN